MKNNLNLEKILSKPAELLEEKDLLCQLVIAQGKEQKYLWQKADQLREENFGKPIHVRGIIEISNICCQNCFYCGIRKANQNVDRYKMSVSEILEICQQMDQQQIRTVVLQAGEKAFRPDEINELLVRIKNETDLAITLSLGEYSAAVYQKWAELGMDRYLMRFETCNQKLFQQMHPDDNFAERINYLKILQKLKVQTGSGFLIGLPGSTLEDLVNDLIFCTNLDLDMIGVGPFIPAVETPLATDKNVFTPAIFFNTIALLRILNPLAHLPATTAFDSCCADGRSQLFDKGINVFMPNFTPEKYRKNYNLYAKKTKVDLSLDEYLQEMHLLFKKHDRFLASDRGDSLKLKKSF